MGRRPQLPQAVQTGGTASRSVPTITRAEPISAFLLKRRVSAANFATSLLSAVRGVPVPGTSGDNAKNNSSATPGKTFRPLTGHWSRRDGAIGGIGETPQEFCERCRNQRFDHPFRPLSQICDRCGITYEAHFDHPQRCPAWMTDEVDRQGAEEPTLLF
jgi:hypothetical protein